MITKVESEKTNKIGTSLVRLIRKKKKKERRHSQPKSRLQKEISLPGLQTFLRGCDKQFDVSTF